MLRNQPAAWQTPGGTRQTGDVSDIVGSPTASSFQERVHENNGQAADAPGTHRTCADNRQSAADEGACGHPTWDVAGLKPQNEPGQAITESERDRRAVELCLYDVVQPLLKLVHAQYEDDVSELIFWGDNNIFPSTERLILMEFEPNLKVSPGCARVIATLLWKTGSFTTASGRRNPAPYCSPLRFHVLKDTLCLGPFGLRSAAFLAITHRHEVLDLDAAECQVDLLVDFLGKEENLLPYTEGIL